jgi:hypothetical protein
MTVSTAVGAKIYISDATSTASNQGEFEALTWIEVEQTESIGEFGDTTNPVTFIGLGDARVQKKKGSADAGTLNVVMAFNEVASGSPITGQYQFLIAANDTTSFDYGVKITLNDATTGSPVGTDTTFYFNGQVGTFVRSAPGADEILRVTSEVRINSAIITVAQS